MAPPFFLVIERPPLVLATRRLDSPRVREAKQLYPASPTGAIKTLTKLALESIDDPNDSLEDLVQAVLSIWYSNGNQVHKLKSEIVHFFESTGLRAVHPQEHIIKAKLCDSRGFLPIYRGFSSRTQLSEREIKNRLGINWTLDKNVGRRFAFYHEHTYFVSARIKLEHIFAYLEPLWHEHEIFVDTSKLCKVLVNYSPKRRRKWGLTDTETNYNLLKT